MEPPTKASKQARTNSSQAIIRRHLYGGGSAAEGGEEANRNLDSAAEPPVMDGARVISKECYEEWLNTRTYEVKKPERTFQRILTSHLTASDGRTPFTTGEEDAILEALRVKRVWPAFEGTQCIIGSKGFKARGFHEKKAKGLAVKTTNKSASYSVLPDHNVDMDGKRGRKRARLPTSSEDDEDAHTLHEYNDNTIPPSIDRVPPTQLATPNLMHTLVPNNLPLPVVQPMAWPHALPMFWMPPHLPGWFTGTTLSMPQFAPCPPNDMPDLINLQRRPYT